MQLGFWKTLKKPILALAPMANVTDAAFRFIIAKYGHPDVMFTEFTSVEGLLSRGKEKLLVDFWYSESERPIVAQIFGGKPEQFKEVAQLIQKLGFDGIDINMGCPDSGVEKSGGGAALIKNPKLAQEIIRAAQEGAPNLPISVKTRLGYNKNEIESWLPALLETGLAAITVHLRTRKEMSAVPAHWELAPEIMRIALPARNAARIAAGGHATQPRLVSARRARHMHERTLILGNGDVATVAEAKEKAAQYGLDGVMIGRGVFGNPWLFRSAEKPGVDRPYPTNPSYSTYVPSVEEKLRVCLEHTKLFEELFGDSTNSKAASYKLQAKSFRKKPFDIMKKHYKAYINGFDGAKELRGKLMQAKNVKEVEAILKAFQAVEK